MCFNLLSAIDFIALHAWICKIWWMILRQTSTMSGLTIAAVTLERCIVVIFPLKAKAICTKRRAKISIASIDIIAFLLNVHYLFTFGLWTHQKGSILISGCSGNHPDPVRAYIGTCVKVWSEFVSVFLLPILTILICNFVIIYQLIKQRSSRGQMVITEADKDFRSTTALLLTLSFYYLVSFLPGYITPLFWPVDPFEFPIDSEMAATKNLIIIVNRCLINATFGCNFLIYIISGSSFRGYMWKAFVNITGCKGKASTTAKKTEPSGSTTESLL